ncbi:MAG: DNA methylase N-4 [Gammaproteobacteria bacterium]|nr:DNA methylase N-4 [Gammaproteobacteria bacterium]
MKQRNSLSHLGDLQVTYLSVTALKPAPHNPRTHSPKQVQQVANSIQSFGFTNPILIDEANNVIAGHGRLGAAKILGMQAVPTIQLEHMTDAQKREYLIADNKLAENAGWDISLLATELETITELDLDFDITLTGFETAEIDVLVEQHRQAIDVTDTLPDIDPDLPSVSQIGDLWQIGRHRLLCGDATKDDTFEHLMAGSLAHQVFVDPPYNVPIDGHVCGSGSIKHREFNMASGEMSEPQFISFLTTVFTHLVNYSTDGSIHHVCMDWRHMHEILTAGKTAYTELKNLCVWNKHNAGMGSLYRSKHELVFVFKSGTQPHINNIELGKHGRYRTNVWDYDGVNSLDPSRREELILHPTVKPVAMVADAIQDCSKRHHIILDCFTGSGTTLLAAEKTDRCGYGMEMDPHYVDTTIKRLQEHFALEAIHIETGLDFETLKRQRHTSKPTQKRQSGQTLMENPDAR